MTCDEFDKISPGNSLGIPGDVRNSEDVEKVISTSRRRGTKTSSVLQV